MGEGGWRGWVVAYSLPPEARPSLQVTTAPKPLHALRSVLNVNTCCLRSLGFQVADNHCETRALSA